MKKSITTLLVVAILSFVVSSTATANTIYSTFGPGDSYKFSTPVVGCGTGFHGNCACRQLSEELADLVASEHSFLHLLVVLIQTDDVKNVLCQVQADSGNIHLGLLSHSVDGW